MCGSVSHKCVNHHVQPQQVYIPQPRGILLTNSRLLVKHTLRHNEPFGSGLNAGWAEPQSPACPAEGQSLAERRPCRSIKVFSLSTWCSRCSALRHGRFRKQWRGPQSSEHSPGSGWATFTHRLSCGSDRTDANPDGSVLYTPGHIRGEANTDLSSPPFIPLIADYSSCCCCCPEHFPLIHVNTPASSHRRTEAHDHDPF